MRIKSTHPESQGEFVEIDESAFDPETMTKYVEGEQSPPAPSAEPSKNAALTKQELLDTLIEMGADAKPAMSKAELVSMLDQLENE